MLKRTLWTLSLALLVTAACTPVSPPDEERSSYDAWQDDVKAALKGIDSYLDEHDSENAAIVLDIDNTALETEYHPGKANPPVLKAEKYARKLGMTVLIVTARKEHAKEKSLAELRAAGYSPDDICLREFEESKSKGKARCRKEFTEAGHEITANIGNRDTDFKGGYYDRAFQLPDYDGQLS
ncbi:HAD family acid phosphatase [Stackebrandtia nassauensis]|uniref:Acid phosphatase (Class B) n=1 Tax=Stackebrandtia nassauensis (strain DSM 44728 / CIP 108903 / NRRL B-16338 / NBRC 102104 / LLR-40K-21) TaxID=446470 RepID=D3Q9E8_STANL|nr:HAD family acid phosphatase [Stackebrandtia nassauensis]ADD42630.1 acid phosphatase (Class B) [Stackebrandtia nassauensis DSM 44728]